MATLSLSSVVSDHNGVPKHPNVENGADHDVVLSNLMTKLKMTSKQIKAWSQTSHKLRLAMSKYTEPDPVDPTRLQKCMDKLKTAIKVSSLPAMNERLDSIARQLGLKANWSMDKMEVFLSSDSFYVEVKLAPNGSVKDVLLVHGMTGHPQSCAEMSEVLQKNDFKEFTEHLKGLCQMYQLGMDNKMKSIAFSCLQALEKDLKTLFQVGGTKVVQAQTQGSSVNPLLHIMKGPVGYLTSRVGGHSMRLTYFVSPYDLLDVEKKRTTELSLNEPLPKDLGLSVTVGMENATQRKIQNSPIIIATDSKIQHVLPLTNQNSITIMASFILKLSQPMPTSIFLMKQLQNFPGVSTQYADLSTATPLNTLVCRFTLDPLLQNQAKDGRYMRTNTFHVELPDQLHSYIINDGATASDHRDMQGALLSKININSANSVLNVVKLLRQQAVYNTLIASCVRSKSMEDPSDALLFEVTPFTHQKLTITFEHPAKDGVACVELDLTDHSAVKAKIHGRPGEEPFCSDEYATKVVQKCLSIPITMRAIMKKASQWMETHQPKKSLSMSPAPSSGPSGSMFDPVNSIHRPGGVGGGHGGSFFGSHRSHQPSSSSHNQYHSNNILSDLTTTISAILPHGEVFDFHGERPTKVVQNPMLASLLQHVALAGNVPPPATQPPLSPMGSPPAPSGPKPHKNPMLMNLLQETTTLTPVAVTAQPGSHMGRVVRKGKRSRSMSSDKSPKRQLSEEDHDFDDVVGHRMHQLQRRVSDNPKMSHSMDPPRGMGHHSGELSALLSEINDLPPVPVTKPKRGRPCRLDSSSSQSSIISARQSPKTPSTPSVPTTPTFAPPPKAVSHSTLSTPEHPSMDDMPMPIKVEPLHHRTSIDSDIFAHNTKSLFPEDLLPEDEDEDFGLPSVSSAIAHIFNEQPRTTTDLPPPVTLPNLSGPLPTAIQAGLETITDVSKMGQSAVDLGAPNLSKSLSISDISTGQRGKPSILATMQSVSDLSHSLPPARPRVPVSKGKPKNFTESGPAMQAEGSRKGSKKRGRKAGKDFGGFSDSDAPKSKKRGRTKKRIVAESSSDSSPEPSPDIPHEKYSSITMAVNKEQPMKITFKTVRHKPEKEVKARARDSGIAPAPKIKIRAMTSGESATPSPNPIVKEMKLEEKAEIKTETKIEIKTERPEKIEYVQKPVKLESAMKIESPSVAKVLKDESVSRPPKDLTSHRSDEPSSKIQSHDTSSKGGIDISVVKSEPSVVKTTGALKQSASIHVSKARSDLIKKSKPVDAAQRGNTMGKAPFDFLQRKNLSSLPRIPKISKQTSESKQSPNSKTSTPPKTGGSPSPGAKSLLVSPKKSVWGKDPSKGGTAKKIVTAQRMVSPTVGKPGARLGMVKQFPGNKYPSSFGTSVKKPGPNILSKSSSSPTFNTSASRTSTGVAQGPSKSLLNTSSQGVTKPSVSLVKQPGSVSPLIKSPTVSVPKLQTTAMSAKLLTPTSSANVSSKVSGTQGISLYSAAKNTTSNISTPTSKLTSSTSSDTSAASSGVTTVSTSASVAMQSSTSDSVTTPKSSGSNTNMASSNASISASIASQVVTSPAIQVSPKTSTVTGIKTSTGSNRPPPLVIPQNIKVPPPSITSPPTPSSAGTPTSAGPNSAKLNTLKPGMRGGRKVSLMGIIDKIKETKSVEKVDKVDKVEKSEKVERAGIFSALGSGSSGLGDNAGCEVKDKPDVGKDSADGPAESNEGNKSEATKSLGNVNAELSTKEAKGADMVNSVSKAEATRPQTPKVSLSGNQSSSSLPSPLPSSKQPGLISSPSTQVPSMVKSKSSPKHPSQSRPPKVSTPPLSGSQKRAGSPTGRSMSAKPNKPSPLTTSGTPTSTSLSSPVKTSARPGTSPMSRSRPIILSHTSSTYQSAERGQQKVTKVQLVMQPELMSPSVLAGQTSPTVGKIHMGSSHVRVPSPSLKHQTSSSSKASDPGRKQLSQTQKSSSDNSKTETKFGVSPKQTKADQGTGLKPKPSTAKELPTQTQSIQKEASKGTSDNSGSKAAPAPIKKSDTKPTDPRMKRDSFGPGKDKDGDTSKTSKPAVMRSVSKDGRPVGSSGSQEGRGSTKSEQKVSTESSQKTKTTIPVVKPEAKKIDKEKQRSEEVRKSELKISSLETKGADKQDIQEEAVKGSCAVPPGPGPDFKVPSPAMVPSPRNPTSPKPVIKPALSPKPAPAYTASAPSPLSSANSSQEPGNGSKAATKRSATPVNLTQPPPSKKARHIPAPYSPVDSDEDFGMVIDDGHSPRPASMKPQRSPRPESRNSNTQTEAGSTSPRSAIAHSPLGQLAQSPLGIGKSPASVKSIDSGSLTRSPCKIDDDLMDEVLTTSIQTEDL